MFYCMVTTQMKVSDVIPHAAQFAANFVLPSNLFPFPITLTPAVSRSYVHTDQAGGSVRCHDVRPSHDTRPAVAPSLANALQEFLLSGFWFFFDETCKNVLSLKHWLFLSTGRQTPGKGNGSCGACWCRQHPDTSCWQMAWFLREVEFFICFIQYLTIICSYKFHMKSIIFEK